MSSNKVSLSRDDRELLLSLVPVTIEAGVRGVEPQLDAAEYSEALRSERASFVTLNLFGQLRGCIGTLEATRPLVTDVVHNAYAAAFRDPRFPPVAADEVPHLEVHISLLTPAEPMQFASEVDLVAQLQPGVDGLILIEGRRRGTFLPSVWEQLPEPQAFLQHLKRKAGLDADYWSDAIEVLRYTTEAIP